MWLLKKEEESRHRKHFTKEEEEKIRELKEKGMKPQEIARELKRKPRSIYNYFYRRGLKVRVGESISKLLERERALKSNIDYLNDVKNKLEADIKGLNDVKSKLEADIKRLNDLKNKLKEELQKIVGDITYYEALHEIHQFLTKP